MRAVHWVGILVIAALLAGAGFWIHRLQEQAAEARAAERATFLVKDSLEAALDSTRTMMTDSLQIARRRAFQTELERDRLDSLYQSESRARINTELRLSELEDSVSGVAVETDPGTGVRAATFHFDTLLVDIQVDAELGEATARADIHVEFDPIPLQVRAQCRPDSLGEFYEAEVFVTTPAALSGALRVHVSESFLDPELCNPLPPPPPSIFEQVRAAALPVTVAATLAYLLAKLTPP